MNSKASLLHGDATMTVQNNTLTIQSNNPGQLVSGQFDILLETDGISDDQWQLSKGGGQSVTHVDVYNLNNYESPTFIAGVDNVSIAGTTKNFIISGRSESLGGPLSIEAAGPKKVFAIYCPWWAANTSKWSASYAIDNPFEPFLSLRQADVNRRVQTASGAGINGFLSSWQGKEHFAETAFQLLLNAAHEKPDFSVAVYLETGVANQGHTYGEPPDPAYMRKWIQDVVRDHGADPSYLKMNGKPVIFIYRARYFTPDVWKNQVFDPLRAEGIDAFYVGDYVSWDRVAPLPEYLAVFDGLHSYNPSVYSTIDSRSIYNCFSINARATKTYSLLNDPGAPRKVWMGTAVPGFDTTHLYNPGLLIPRDETSFYRSMWDDNLASNPDWMLITTWNDYGENTHIEPSLSYGSTYLDISREYIAGFKAANDPAPFSISGLNAESFIPGGIEASWSTDRASSAEIDYGSAPGVYVGSSASPGLRSEHRVAVTGLQPGMYFARAKSIDSSGAEIFSPEFSVVVPSGQPASLVLSQENIYWRDFASYLERQLTVDFHIANMGIQDANEVAFIDISTSDRVSPGQFPPAIDEIRAGGSAVVSINFEVPAGVTTFELNLWAQARSADGTKIYFPAPPPS
jgi:hypothetical protein